MLPPPFPLAWLARKEVRNQAWDGDGEQGACGAAETGRGGLEPVASPGPRGSPSGLARGGLALGGPVRGRSAWGGPVGRGPVRSGTERGRSAPDKAGRSRPELREPT